MRSDDQRNSSRRSSHVPSSTMHSAIVNGIQPHTKGRGLQREREGQTDGRLTQLTDRILSKRHIHIMTIHFPPRDRLAQPTEGFPLQPLGGREQGDPIWLLLTINLVEIRQSQQPNPMTVPPRRRHIIPRPRVTPSPKEFVLGSLGPRLDVEVINILLGGDAQDIGMETCLGQTENRD